MKRRLSSSSPPRRSAPSAPSAPTSTLGSTRRLDFTPNPRNLAPSQPPYRPWASTSAKSVDPQRFAADYPVSMFVASLDRFENSLEGDDRSTASSPRLAPQKGGAITQETRKRVQAIVAEAKTDQRFPEGYQISLFTGSLARFEDSLLIPDGPPRRWPETSGAVVVDNMAPWAVRRRLAESRRVVEEPKDGGEVMVEVTEVQKYDNKEEMTVVNSIEQLTTDGSDNGAAGLEGEGGGSFIMDAIERLSIDNSGSGRAGLDGTDSYFGAFATPAGPASSAATLSPNRYAGSPQPIARPGSASSTKSQELEDEDVKVDVMAFASLFDFIRAGVRKGRVPNAREAQQLEYVFEMCINLVFKSRNAELAFVTQTRLDKMLEDLLAMDRSFFIGDLSQVLGEAGRLQYLLRDHLGEAYNKIDEERAREMQEVGNLRGVSLDPEPRIESGRWIIVPSEPIEDPRPGMWWLDLNCALRDGVITAAQEGVTPGPGQGLLVVTLLNGRMRLFGEFEYKYSNESVSDQDITYLQLLNTMGKEVRMFTGHLLKYEHGPLVGIRYEGRFRVKSRGRSFDPATQLYYHAVLFERLDGGEHPQTFRRPSAADIDDWMLYIDMIGEDIRDHEGNWAYQKWKQDLQKKEREKYDLHHSRGWKGKAILPPWKESTEEKY